MGKLPGPTSNALPHNTFAVPRNTGNMQHHNQRRNQPSQAVNIDRNGGNLNIPVLELEESKLAATTAELETILETWGGTMLETRAVWFSARNAATKVGKDC